MLNESLESTWLVRLNWLAVLAMIIVSWNLAREEDLHWFGFILLAFVVAAVTIIRWPYGAILVLIAASVVSRFSVGVFGWNARPEHFAAAIVSLAACLWLAFSGHKLRLEPLDYWVIAYIGLNYLSSLFGSSSPSQTLRWALLNNLAVMPYLLIRQLVRNVETLRQSVRILVVVGIGECVYGILCLLWHHMFGSGLGVERAQYLGDVAAPYGSLYEPNFFGDYAACCAALCLGLYLVGNRHRLRYLLGFFVASLAAFVSFSRAALLALVLGAIWVLWMANRSQPTGRNKLAFSLAGLGLALGLVVLITATAVGGVTKQRFTNLFQLGLADQTTVTRLIVTEEALRDLPSHPILGNGTASFNITFDWAHYVPDWAGDKQWIGNAPLRIVHDTGLLGLITIVGFVVTVWRKIRRALRDSATHVGVLVALCAGTLVYCISFQFSDATTLAFFWVHVGFLASAAVLFSRQTRQRTFDAHVAS